METIVVERVYALDAQAVAPLLDAAASERSPIVRTLVDEWAEGVNRFDRAAGEALWRAGRARAWIAVGGLNVDPWAHDPRVGRVRRFYVLPAQRNAGCGARLLAVVLAHAREHFDRLVLHTDRAGAFYERHGFVRRDDERTQSTHELDLRLGS